MSQDNKFYVYQYLREDGTPYYIGKGNGRRAYNNSGRPCSTPKDKNRIVKIAENLTETQAFELEKDLIAKFGRKDKGTGILRNLTDGGEGAVGAIRSEEFRKKVAEYHTGRKHSEKTKQKLSESHKGKKLSPEHIEKMRQNLIGKKQSEESKAKRRGKPAWNKGKSGYLSEESIQKIKEARANQVISPESRAKAAESNRGKKRTEEFRQRLSEIAKQRPPLSPEVRKKIGEKNRGRKQSPEELAKRSAALKGHKVSEETREKLRLASRGKKHTEETKQKIRKARAKQIPWNKGKKTGPLSQETREKLRFANIKKQKPIDLNPDLFQIDE